MSENVVIKKDRTVTVPASEAKIGVQYDHNVNVITFDCPRYPDDDRNVDLSTMQIYINYMLPDKTLGSYLAENVKVDTNNPDTIHFDWKITRNVTQVKGALQALVCIKKVDAEGNELYHWNTDLIQSFRVGEGMECLETISSDYADVISQLLVNMNTVTGEFEALSADVTARTSEETLQGLVNNAASDEKLRSIVDAYMEANPVGINVDDTLTVSGDAADAKITGDRITELKGDLVKFEIVAECYESKMRNGAYDNGVWNNRNDLASNKQSIQCQKGDTVCIEYEESLKWLWVEFFDKDGAFLKQEIVGYSNKIICNAPDNSYYFFFGIQKDNNYIDLSNLKKLKVYAKSLLNKEVVELEKKLDEFNNGLYEIADGGFKACYSEQGHNIELKWENGTYNDNLVPIESDSSERAMYTCYRDIYLRCIPDENDSFKFYKKDLDGNISILSDSSSSHTYFRNLFCNLKKGESFAVKHNKNYELNIEIADKTRDYDELDVIESFGVIKGSYIKDDGDYRDESNSYILKSKLIAPFDGYMYTNGEEVRFAEYDKNNVFVRIIFGDVISVKKDYIYTIAKYRASIDSCIFSKSLPKVDVIKTIEQGIMSGGGNLVESNSGLRLTLNAKKGDLVRIILANGYHAGFLKGDGSIFNGFKGMPIIDGELLVDSKPYVCIYADDGELTIDDARNVIKDIHIVEKRGNGDYDFIIAPSDASDYDKEIADLVCDGINDEDEINCAVNCNIISNKHKSKVLLLDGNYYLNNYHRCSSATNSRDDFGNGVIEIKYKSDYYTCSIHGTNNANKEEGSCFLNITKDLYDSISSDEVSIICATRKGNPQDTQNGISGGVSNYIEMEVKNIHLDLYKHGKPIIGIDGVGTSNMRVDECRIVGDSEKHSPAWNVEINYCNDNCVGIRGVAGNNRGYAAYIKRSCTIACGQGIALLGEHFIVEDCLMHSCKTGLTVGNYNSKGQMQHPNTFIGCSIEGCYRFGILNRFGMTQEMTYDEYVSSGIHGNKATKQTIIYISGSTEGVWIDSNGNRQYTLPFKETIKGAYRGRMEMDFLSRNMFEDGDGLNIVQTKYI